MDELLGKAKEAVGKDENVDKLADKADEATDGKYSEHIDKGKDMLKDKLGDQES